MPGLVGLRPLGPANEGRHPLQPRRKVGTDPGGRGKVRWGRNNGDSSSNPSWFLADVSLTLAHALRGYEGQRHRKRGALAWRALDVDGPVVGQDDFAHDVQPQAC